LTRRHSPCYNLGMDNTNIAPVAPVAVTPRRISFDRVSLDLTEAPAGYRVEASDYGYDLTSESQITVRMTTRSDSRTSWVVLLSEPDGLIRVRSGLSDTTVAAARIEVAIYELTVDAGWTDPINRVGA
jgi:hypothetical protein